MSNSGGVFRLNVFNVSGNARFFLLSKLYVALDISLELVEIYKLYDLDLIFV